MVDKFRKIGNLSPEQIYQKVLGLLFAGGFQPPMVSSHLSLKDLHLSSAYNSIRDLDDIIHALQLVQISTIR